MADTAGRFRAAQGFFRCPLCGTDMAFRNDNSLVCSRGHCCDLSRYGYLNFSPSQGKTKYDAALFESRRRVFRDGFYTPALAELEALIREFAPHTPAVLLDAGCGEGYFVAELSPEHPIPNRFAMDLEKSAVLLAAKAYRARDIKWIVGDLANIPLKDGSVDVLLNILAPANYGEFQRVLRPDGLIVKVVPGQDHLRELREQFGKPAYSNERVVEHFRASAAIHSERQLTYRLPLTGNQLGDLIRMTPLAFHTGRTAAEAVDITDITIDLSFLAGKKN